MSYLENETTARIILCVFVLSINVALAESIPPQFVLEWGSNGTGEGQFGGSHGIEVDADGNVYVADTGNWDGQFNFPRGLSTDTFGNVYVCDRNDHPMQKFTGTGTFLASWGSFGNGEGQFNLPYGIRAGADGIVYVSDSSNFRVQKFQFDLSIIFRDGFESRPE